MIFFALLLSLLMLVSFEQTSTGVFAAGTWAVLSFLAFYNPLPY